MKTFKGLWENDPVYRQIKKAYDESIKYEYHGVTEVLADALIRCRIHVINQKEPSK